MISKLLKVNQCKDSQRFPPLQLHIIRQQSLIFLIKYNYEKLYKIPYMLQGTLTVIFKKLILTVKDGATN